MAEIYESGEQNKRDTYDMIRFNLARGIKKHEAHLIPKIVVLIK
jgi:hypothetical protein